MIRKILLLLVILIAGLAIFFLFKGKSEKPIIAAPIKVKTDDSLVFKQLEKISTYKFADSLYFADAYDSAIQYFDKILFGLPLPNNLKIKQQILNRIGYTYILKADYKNAAVYLKEALKLADNKDTCVTNAITYDYIGTLKEYTNEPDSALFYFQKAFPYYTRTIGEKNIMFIKFLNRLANVYKYSYQDYINSEKYNYKAIQLLEAFGEIENCDLFLSILNDLTKTSILKMDYNKALSYGLRAVQLASANRDGRRYLSYSYSLVGQIYMNLRDYKKAIEFIDKALENNKNDFHLRSTLLNNKAVANIVLHNYKTAINNCKEAVKNLHDVSKDYIYISSSLTYLGITYQELGKFDVALDYFKRTLAIQKKYLGENNYFTARTYYLLAQFYKDSKRIDSALYYNQKALISSSVGFDKQDITQNPLASESAKKPFVIDYLENKAACLELKHLEKLSSVLYLEQSLNCYKLIDSLVSSTRQLMETEDSKLSVTANKNQLYEKAIECAYRLFTATKKKEYIGQAFHFFEKNKSLILLENLNAAEANNSAGVSDSLVTKERNCNAELNLLKDKLNLLQKKENKDFIQIRKMNDRIFDLVRKLEKIRNIIKQNHPGYYTIKFQGNNYKLSDVQTYAKVKNALILQYFWGSDAIYSISIKDDTVRFSKIPRNAEFQNNLDAFVSQCQQVNMGSRDKYKQYAAKAQYLFDALVKPVVYADLPDESDPGNIIIIPDGQLSGLSFEALVNSSSKTAMFGYKNLDYLIYHYNIQYAYSSNILLSKNGNDERRYASNLLGFGYSGDGVSEQFTSGNATLPGSYHELKTISKYYHAKVFLGENATVRNFKQFAPDYDILHLALHGMASKGDDTITSLLFRSGKAGQEETHLYSRDVYGMNLKAKLIVLSACETGLGKNYSGEGVFSMARAFSYAGCPSVVLSLWDVSDRSTSTIMGTFYRNLSKGDNIDKALRSAKVDYLKNCDEFGYQPIYWASFISYGDMASIKPSGHFWIWAIVILPLITVLLLSFLRLKKYRNS